MFFKRARAMAAAEAAVRQAITLYSHLHGQPARFWEDQFVLGYAAGVTNASAGLVYGLRQPPAVEDIICKTLARVTGLNIDWIAKKMVSTADTDFKRGADLGFKLHLYAVGAIELKKGRSAGHRRR